MKRYKMHLMAPERMAAAMQVNFSPDNNCIRKNSEHK